MRTVPIALVLLSAPAGALGQTFVDRTESLGVAPGGEHAAWGDVDGDGWPDLWMGGAIWLNRGGTGFVRVDAPGTGVVADIDNDGLGDLISRAPIGVRRAVARDGAVAFVDVALPAVPQTVSRAVAAGDFNGDGFVDFQAGGYEDWPTQTTYPSMLFLNEGGKGFRIATQRAERRTRGVTACDFDEDGDLDLYASNYRLQPNELFVNDGKGGLADAAAARGAVATSDGFAGGHSIGACFADFDGDGRFDLFAGNFAHVDSRGDQPKSRFLRNRGPSAGFAFEDLGTCGVFYQESYASPAAGDFDNDGRLDLYLTTVYETASFNRRNNPVLFRNETAEGGWSFVDRTETSGLAGLPATYMAAWADFDRDGDLDLATAGRLYANAGAAGTHWLGVRLSGDGTRVNRGALGAQVRLAVGGRTLVRQVEAGTAEGCANAPLLHFGLGGHAGPVRLAVLWPGGAATAHDVGAVDRVVEVAFAQGGANRSGEATNEPRHSSLQNQ